MTSVRTVVAEESSAPPQVSTGTLRALAAPGCARSDDHLRRVLCVLAAASQRGCRNQVRAYEAPAPLTQNRFTSATSASRLGGSQQGVYRRCGSNAVGVTCERERHAASACAGGRTPG